MRDSISDFIFLVAIVMATCDVSDAPHIPRRDVTSSQQTSLESQHTLASNAKVSLKCNHSEFEQIHGEYYEDNFLFASETFWCQKLFLLCSNFSHLKYTEDNNTQHRQKRSPNAGRLCYPCQSSGKNSNNLQTI